jgi:hypothetical protein
MAMSLFILLRNPVEISRLNEVVHFLVMLDTLASRAVSRGPGVVSLGGDRRSPIKALLIDGRRVLTQVAPSVPDERPRVEGVLQNICHRASSYPAALARTLYHRPNPYRIAGNITS